ncbi:MAG TPA: alanine racemase [Candidatus Scatomonas merdigallinarum]|nr:alanine racemase [Candidatus Scatomonas merdigallinarum]
MSGYLRCYAEVSLKAIGHNIAQVKKRLRPGVKLLAVIKADAYGHGAVRVGKYLEDQVDYFAVATAEEAMELREQGIRLPVLVLGYISPEQYGEILDYDITQTVYSLEIAEKLSEASVKAGCRTKIHAALDTGMTRIGFHITEEEADRIAAISRLPGLELEGMFTHFSCADQKDKTYCGLQLEKFRRMEGMLRERGVEIPVKHICNSAGIMEFDDYRFDMVRSGIVTYGLYPSEEVDKSRLPLIPALSWKSRVIHVQDVEPGLGVSYGATYTTEGPCTRIATVSAGYADGYPRALSNKGRVLIHGRYAPILGRVCMDQMMVDVSHIPDVKVEDTVTLIGREGDRRITMEEVADPACRFNYEMACGISKRVPRIYPD